MLKLRHKWVSSWTPEDTGNIPALAERRVRGDREAQAGELRARGGACHGGGSFTADLTWPLA